MHSISRAIRCGGGAGAVGIRCHLSRDSKRLLLCGRFLSVDRSAVAGTGGRYFCSSKSNEGDDGSGPGKDDTKVKVSTGPEAKEGKPSNKSSEAKAKLNMLLKSIVKQSKEVADRKSQQGAINMRLAIPIKEKPVEETLPEKSKTPEEVETEKELGAEMVQAVKQVAETIKGDEQAVAVESELVQKLKTQVGKKINLSDVFAGMKIDRTKKASTTPSAVDIDLSRAHRVRKILDQRPGATDDRRSRSGGQDQRQKRGRSPAPSRSTYVPIDLFGASPLGIFDPVVPKDTTETPKLETWQTLFARDLKLSVTHPPANGFEEMITWTEQGKLWKFPIDNEQGLDEEAKVPFHEHVFLEPQLESWCPQKGPIRHFMELVCSGLSKNPFITVKEKHEQIEWYHQYFKEKSSIIKEVGAGEIK